MSEVVVVYSGGLDSTVMLYDLVDRDFDVVHALSFNYGQSHVKELSYAKEHCDSLRIPLSCIDLKLPYLGVPLIDGEGIPDGYYTDESMKQTIVPNRNAIMLSIAYGVAVNLHADLVAIAAHSGDHPIYPDCRAAFMDCIEKAFQLGTDQQVKIFTPYVSVDKTEIVRVGNKIGVEFEKTWSCYKGMGVHCGKCGTCTERREAFTLAEVFDPTTYEEEL